MATAAIHLHDEAAPAVDVMTIDSTGERFIKFEHDGLTVFLPGMDGAAAKFARKLAIHLLRAAEDAEAPKPSTATEPPVAQVPGIPDDDIPF